MTKINERNKMYKTEKQSSNSDLLTKIDPSFLLLSALSLHELRQFSVSELMDCGLNEDQASRLTAVISLASRLYETPATEIVRISSPVAVFDALKSDMMFLEQEHLVVVSLNTRNEIASIDTLYIGSLNSSVVRIAEIFKTAIKNNAAAIIISHNHPSGDPSPSPEDVNITRQIAKAGRMMDIELLDHVIIGMNKFVSLKERGLGFD